MPYPHDTIDKALLSELRDNARITTSELSRRLGVSRSTVQSRLKRLEDTQVVSGYRVQLGPGYARNRIQAHSTQELSHLLDKIANLEGIERTNSSLILETKFER